MSRIVEIRLASPTDAEAVLEIYKPYITDTVVTFEESVPSVGGFRQRMAAILEEAPYLLCVIDSEIVGYAYASAYRSRTSYRWNREVTVYIKSGFQRMNIGTALYAALLAILKKQNYMNLLAVVTLPNEGSVRLHERMGFKACAVFHKVGYKMNCWHDVGWWELNEAGPDPQEPVLFKNFDDDILLERILAESSGFVQI